MLLSPNFVKTLNIEDFVAKKVFPMVVFALCATASIWLAMDIAKMAHKDMYVKNRERSILG